MAPWVALWADSSPLMMPFSPSDPASSETRTPPSTPIHRCTSLIGSQPLCLATTSGIRTILSANKTNSTWVTKSCFILCTHQVPRLDHKITICSQFSSNLQPSSVKLNKLCANTIILVLKLHIFNQTFLWVWITGIHHSVFSATSSTIDSCLNFKWL